MPALRKLEQSSSGCVSVPRLWPGSTVVCIGGGPSLTREDVEFCRGRAPVIAIKDAQRLAPWAEVLYSGDDKWWKWYRGAPEFSGLKFGLEPTRTPWPGVEILDITGDTGIEQAPTGLRTGSNSGYQAVNLAIHLGATRVLLLGYDMKPTNGRDHWFGSHPYGATPPYQLFLDRFPTMVEPLKELGVEVLNVTRDSALDVFPRAALEQVL